MSRRPHLHDPGAPRGRDARREAQEVLGADLEARVLEPSPPAVVDGEWFADDPVAVGARSGAGPVVSPVAGGDLTWDDWLADHPERAAWAAQRWLGARRRVGPAPPGLPDGRLALHRLAAFVVSPARRRATGRMGLRWTLDGIGTPFFGAEEQLRVEGRLLVRQRGDSVHMEPITSLAGAASLGLEGPPDLAWAADLDVPDPGDPDADLPIEPGVAAFLADWYGFAWSVLEEVRADAASTEAGRVQLWPEHFDAAFECLPEHRRATFGASPGDAAIEEPYLYVLPPRALAVTGRVWNSDAFPGAVLTLGELLRAEDQRAAALAFLRTRRAAIGER
jgi:hypothetical protein